MAQGSSPYTFSNLIEDCELLVEKTQSVPLVDLMKKLQEINNQEDSEIGLIKEAAKQFQKGLKDKEIKISDGGTKFLEKLVKDGKASENVTVLQVKQGSEDGQVDRGRSLRQKSSQQKVDQKDFSKTFNVNLSPEAGQYVKELQELGVKSYYWKEQLSQVEEQCKNKELEINKRDADLKNKDKEVDQMKGDLQSFKEQSGKRLFNLTKENEDLREKLRAAEENVSLGEKEYEKLHAVCKDLDKKLKQAYDQKSKQAKDDFKRYQELKNDHEDLKNRFSRQAASKLADGNPDITDLSDPNRAMKLAETFSGLYDDSWTDAYSYLTDSVKKSPQEASQYLLNVLNECYAFCKQTEATQMDSLKNVLLHPVQDPGQCESGATGKGGLKQPRIASKEEQSLRTLRRSVGLKTTDVVKQIFLKMQDKGKQSEDDRKTMTESMPFYEKCVEICWSMVLHDPPVRMIMEAKKGDKININMFSKLSATGDKVDYIVWPPLAIAGSDGLLSKGVVQPDGKLKKK